MAMNQREADAFLRSIRAMAITAEDRDERNRLDEIMQQEDLERLQSNERQRRFEEDPPDDRSQASQRDPGEAEASDASSQKRRRSPGASGEDAEAAAAAADKRQRREPPRRAEDVVRCGFESDGEKENWDTTTAPGRLRFYRALGMPRDRRKCYGCNKGRLDSPAICYVKYQKLAKFFKDNIGRMDPIQLARELYLFFDIEIRQEANHFREHDQHEIEEWPAADIYEHFMSHMKECSVRMISMLEKLQDVEETIYEQQLFVPTIDEIGNARVFVNPVAWKMFKEVIQETRKMLSLNPEKMFLYNATMTIDWKEGRPWTNTHERRFKLYNQPAKNLK